MNIGKSCLLIATLLAAVHAKAKVDKACASSTLYTVRSCFSGNTLIATPSGQKKISDFQVGNEILAMDDAGKIVKSIVTDVFIHLKRKTCTLSISDGSKLRVTPEHVFMFVSDSVNKQDLLSGIETDRIGSLGNIHEDYDERSIMGMNFSQEKSSLLKMSQLDEGSNILSAQRVKATNYDSPEEGDGI